jgi:lipoprotein-releasing system permease protein
VISVMNGFDEMWKEKILTFQPHVTVFAYPYGMEEDHPISDRIRELDGVSAVSPFLQTLVMAQFRDAVEQPMLRGIDPSSDFLYRKLLEDPEEVLRDGTLELREMECLIGRDLAIAMGVRAGDRITVFSPANIPQEDEILLPEELRIAGIFEVGMYQIDIGFILTDLVTAREVMGMEEGIHGLQVLGADFLEANTLADQIRLEGGPRFTARSWMQMNQTLFNALTMEKGMMFFLLTIISIVASFLVSCTLIMVSVQKTREIGLLKSMGFRNRTVMGIFMWYGLIQGVAGIVLGNGAGLLVLHFRQSILNGLSNLLGFEVLPKELYYLDGLPSQVVAGDVWLINGLVLLLCLVGGALPAWLAAHKHPVEAMRHDG